MAYVCDELSSSQPATCQKWIALKDSNSIVPELTTQDKDALLIWFIGIFVVVFTVKKLLKLLGV